MTEALEKALLDLKTRQEADQKMLCPRCGRDSMRPGICTNALSRHVDGIYVCPDCGSAEAVLDVMQNPLPLECWAAFREGIPASDFKDIPAEKAMKIIQAEHLPRLIKIFQEWKTEGTDFWELRSKARRECLGLSQIWEQPFHAVYLVADGEVVVRFREKEEEVEIAIDHLAGKR